jgi:hypothetical protein
MLYSSQWVVAAPMASNGYIRDMVILFESLRNWREVQTLKATYFDDIVLKAPLLGL